MEGSVRAFSKHLWPKQRICQYHTTRGRNAQHVGPSRLWRPLQNGLRQDCNAMRGSLPRRRPMSSTSEYIRDTMRKNPVAFPVALTSALLGMAGFAWAASVYMRMYRQMGNYPEKVGLRFRRALYFTDVNPDAAQAVKAFIQTLQLAADERMDPLSDEVIGIKIELVRCLEKSGNVENALEVLTELKQECLKWLDTHSDNTESLARRSKMLSWTCKMATKQAELYSNPAIGDEQKAEENLVWAVETVLRERQRRDKEGITDKDGQGEWLSADEVGSQLEALAHLYEDRGKHYFAAQLFLHALMVKPDQDCHTVILMNNLAAAVAQQTPPREPGLPPPSRAQIVESAKSWAQNALSLAETIEPPLRTPECDQGCVAATHNLGEFAEMNGNIAEAREKYEEAASIAHAIGFEAGVANSHAGLQRINPGSTKSRTWF